MESIEKLQNEAIEAAAIHIRSQRKNYGMIKFICACVTVLLIVAMVCGTWFAIETVEEQQCSLNMQYAEMADVARGATTTEAA